MTKEDTIRMRKPIRSVESIGDTTTKKSKVKGPKKSYRLLKAFGLIFACLAALLLFPLMIIEEKINAVYHELHEPPVFTGPLSENDLLRKADHILTDELAGPESLVLHKGSIFTGTQDGKILEIKNDKIVRIVRASRIPCGHYDDEPKCGRPLGLRILDENTIVYVDAYLGLFKLDIKTGNTEVLVEGGSLVEGRPLTMLNDLAVLKNGTILFTDSSSKHPRRDFMLNILEHSQDGRLLSYDTKTKTVRVLLSGLAFTNGVEVNSDETFALVSELTNARILRYHLKGAKAGKSDTFIDNLPGCPDNIRLSHNGSFWVGLALARKQGKLSIVDFLSTRPGVRNFIAKVVPAKLWETLANFVPGYGLAILIDQNGKIVSSLHDPTGKNVHSVSEIADTGKALYFGSYNAPYLTKLKYN